MAENAALHIVGLYNDGLEIDGRVFRTQQLRRRHKSVVPTEKTCVDV